METYTLKAGRTVNLDGLPFELVNDTEVRGANAPTVAPVEEAASEVVGESGAPAEDAQV